MAVKTKCTFLLCLALIVLSFARAAVDPCSNNGGAEPSHYCEKNSLNKPLTPPLTSKRLVLFINAANGNVDWIRVNSLADGSDWEVQELVLDDFGPIMRDNSFTTALDNSYQTMKQKLEKIRPDILLATSKGVGVIAYLASKGLWVDKPVILFSPIPNPIDGLVKCDLEEMGWNDLIDVYRQYNLGPVLVASGSSSDEELLITNALQEPSACGKISHKIGTFERCRNWRHVVVPGDHGWSSLQGNEATVSALIDFMFMWLEKKKT